MPLLSASHWHGSPHAALSEAEVSGRGMPLAISATHCSTPVSRMTTYESQAPSGEKRSQPSVVSNGARIWNSDGSAASSRATVIPSMSGARHGALLRPLIAMPPSWRRYSSATSGARSARWVNAAAPPVPLTIASATVSRARSCAPATAHDSSAAQVAMETRDMVERVGRPGLLDRLELRHRLGRRRGRRRGRDVARVLAEVLPIVGRG